MSYLSVGAIMGFGGPRGPARVKKPSRPIRPVAVAVARAASPIKFAPGVQKLISVFKGTKRVPTRMTGPSPVPPMILSPVRVAASYTKPTSVLAVNTLTPSAVYSSLAPKVATVSAGTQPGQSWGLTPFTPGESDEMNDEDFGETVETVETDGSPVMKAGAGPGSKGVPWVPLVVAGVIGYILLKGSK